MNRRLLVVISVSLASTAFCRGIENAGEFLQRAGIVDNVRTGMSEKALRKARPALKKPMGDLASGDYFESSESFGLDYHLLNGALQAISYFNEADATERRAKAKQILRAAFSKLGEDPKVYSANDKEAGVNVSDDYALLWRFGENSSQYIAIFFINSALRPKRRESFMLWAGVGIPPVPVPGEEELTPKLTGDQKTATLSEIKRKIQQ